MTPFLTDEEVHRLYAGYRGNEYNSARLAVEPEYLAYISLFADGASEYSRARRAFYEAFLADEVDWGGRLVGLGYEGSNHLAHGFPNARIIDINYDPLKPECLDVVATAELLALPFLLQGVPRPRALLSPLIAALSLGARVWVEVPTEYTGSLRSAFAIREQQMWHGERPSGPLQTLHENLSSYSSRSLRRLLKNCGLTVLESYRSGAGHLGVMAVKGSFIGDD